MCAAADQEKADPGGARLDGLLSRKYRVWLGLCTVAAFTATST